MTKISTGCAAMDDFLEGGYDKDTITTIYGPAGSGKTNLVLLCAAQVAGSGKKVIFVDTEGGFSIDRLSQITPESEKVIENTIFLKPTTFNEQMGIFEKLE